VGHIDEVFAVINYPPGNLNILTASPAAMKRFLSDQLRRGHADDSIAFLLGLTDLPFFWTEKFAQRQSSGRPIPRSWLIQLGHDLGFKTLTIKQILKDKKLMKKWALWQAKIDQSKILVQQALQSDYKKITFVDLPVLWGFDGQALLSNPVNGVHINGTYLMSQPDRTTGYELMWNQDHQNFSVHRQRSQFIAYEQVIEQRLPFLKVKFVSIPEYDDWGGNLHCATNQATSINCYMECRHGG
jgi:hypothetical protein